MSQRMVLAIRKVVEEALRKVGVLYVDFDPEGNDGNGNVVVERRLPCFGMSSMDFLDCGDGVTYEWTCYNE